jgi:hypothetical protein
VFDAGGGVRIVLIERLVLEIRCRTIERMRMVNALCRFVEDAT